jgi:hypothetical protein
MPTMAVTKVCFSENISNGLCGYVAKSFVANAMPTVIMGDVIIWKIDSQHAPMMTEGMAPTPNT